MIHWVFHFLFAAVIVILSFDGLTYCWVRQIYKIFYRINYEFQGWVILLDLDGLKEINDRFGHKKGDKVLRELGKNLMILSSFKAFRLGGDEFVILVPSTNKIKAERIVQKIKFRTPIKFSFGIGKNEEEADQAMYQMKNSRKF